tara:strand:- start:13619 stop:13855 length:237 start_codon:yes stop_codon:yes gene_type:complete
MKVYIVEYFTYNHPNTLKNNELITQSSHKAFANKKDAIKFQSHVKRGIANIPSIGIKTTRIQMDIPISAKGIIKALNF